MPVLKRAAAGGGSSSSRGGQQQCQLVLDASCCLQHCETVPQVRTISLASFLALTACRMQTVTTGMITAAVGSLTFIAIV